MSVYKIFMTVLSAWWMLIGTWESAENRTEGWKNRLEIFTTLPPRLSFSVLLLHPFLLPPSTCSSNPVPFPSSTSHISSHLSLELFPFLNTPLQDALPPRGLTTVTIRADFTCLVLVHVTERAVTMGYKPVASWTPKQTQTLLTVGEWHWKFILSVVFFSSSLRAVYFYREVFRPPSQWTHLISSHKNSVILFSHPATTSVRMYAGMNHALSHVPFKTDSSPLRGHVCVRCDVRMSVVPLEFKHVFSENPSFGSISPVYCDCDCPSSHMRGKTAAHLHELHKVT